MKIAEVSEQYGVSLDTLRYYERIDENNGAVNIELSADDLTEIQNTMPQIKVVGDRY